MGWEPYIKMDTLTSFFVYTRYKMSMAKTTGYGYKDCLSLPTSGARYFGSMRKEADEAIYTYTGKFMRHFV